MKLAQNTGKHTRKKKLCQSSNQVLKKNLSKLRSSAKKNFLSPDQVLQMKYASDQVLKKKKKNYAKFQIKC